MTAWVEGRVAGKRRWSEHLHSLQVAAPEVRFVAGQFARLALPAPPGAKEPMLGRPYSFVNPPQSQPHEFYFIVLPDGPLSPRLAALEPGDPVWLAPRANGFFTISEVPAAASLWCMSTGTGIGPFLSILRTAEPWEKFERVVLVHAVRHGIELTYRDVDRRHRSRARRRVHVRSDGEPRSRIPVRWRDASRRRSTTVGSKRAPASRSPRREPHAMLCGNPAMVEDVQKVARRARDASASAQASRGTSRWRRTGRRRGAVSPRACGSRLR